MPPSERIGLRTDVAYEGAAPASVYFDIGHGRGIPCRSSHHAISTRFEIYTEGHPHLELRPFDGGEPGYLTVADGATILITNMSTELEGDHEFDYLLNYGIMNDTLIEPAKPRMPSPLILRCHTLDPGDDLGPSCSNSNFP